MRFACNGNTNCRGHEREPLVPRYCYDTWVCRSELVLQGLCFALGFSLGELRCVTTKPRHKTSYLTLFKEILSLMGRPANKEQETLR